MAARLLPGLLSVLTCGWFAGAVGAQSPAAPGSTVAAMEDDSPLAALIGRTRWPSVDSMHADFLERFGAAVGLGRARMVTGNMQVSPNMRVTVQTPSDEGASDMISLQYALNSLELIGIAKHRTPVAFTIERHGANAATRERPLTAIEADALRELRAGRDRVTRTAGKSYLVVGALRATAECSRCHAGSAPGDLLGAFSYQLALVPTAPRTR